MLVTNPWRHHSHGARPSPQIPRGTFPLRFPFVVASRARPRRPGLGSGSGPVLSSPAVDRQSPRSTSNAIDLYIRTYYSLLRSSGEVRVRAFEEAHAFSDSSLHTGARDEVPDVAAFGYSATRLPACMTRVRRMVAGQSFAQFERAGLPVRGWQAVSTRGRRRPHRWDQGEVLAVFVTSASDIDDLVPIATAYQIEWNKMHTRLAPSELGRRLLQQDPTLDDAGLDQALGETLGLSPHDVGSLRKALGSDVREGLRAIARGPRDLRLRLLAGTLLEYRRATQRWWEGIETAYQGGGGPPRPVYFVSSNTHALCNLVGGYARARPRGAGRADRPGSAGRRRG